MWRYEEARVALHLFHRVHSLSSPATPARPHHSPPLPLTARSAGSFLCKLTDFSSQVDSNFGVGQSVQISHVFN